MSSVWQWLTAPQNAPIVGALGFILAAIGFPLTLLQVWRTKRAADAATEAANNATIRMNSFSAMRECEHARARARAVNDAIAREDWDTALVHYQDVAVSMMNLSQSNIAFDDEVATSLDEGIKAVDTNCNVIEKSLKGDPTKLTKGKQFAALRPIDNVIAKVLFNLERLST